MTSINNSLVDSFWFWFKIAQLIGNFPFTKVIDEESGFEIVKPLSKRVYIVLELISFGFSYAIIGQILNISRIEWYLLQKKFKTFPSFSTVIGLFISTSQTNFSIHQFIKIAFIDINESFFDALTFMATILISFSMSCILILLNIPLRSSLPKLQTFYAKSLSQILSKKPAISCKFKWKFIVLVFAHAINSQLMLFGLWLYTTEKTNSTYSTHIARIICDAKIKQMQILVD